MHRALAIACALALPAAAQDSVFVDFAGAEIPSSQVNPPDVVRTSAGTISPAPGYLSAFDPVVEGTGFLGSILIPDPVPLGDVLNSFLPGSRRVLYAAVRNPPGTHPATLDIEVLAGTFSGLDLALTFRQEVLADGRGRSSITDIEKPFGLGLRVISGGAVYQRWTPPAPVVSEFHFDGDLLSVRESGVAAESGPAKVRYLDDPAFAPILGGPGQLDEYPDPPTPVDVTRQQSAFGTTASFGIPGVGGEEDTVYRTSPPRNLGDPGNQAKSRGIGLALWPNTRDFWPDDRNGQWTMVWDLLVPAESWAEGYVAPLIQDNHNNDGDADAFLYISGGVLKFGYQGAVGSYVPLPGVGPGEWFRLAIASDGYRTKVGRVFLDGAFVGVTSGDWVYNSCKSTDPRYGDKSSGNPDGTPIAPGDWAAWGEFPRPWAQAPNDTKAPIASTVCLLADLGQRGSPIYIANFLFSDEAMADGQIAGLGGPNARGIVWLTPPECGADFNGDGLLNVFDFLAFQTAFSDGDGSADLDGNGVLNIFDFLAFQTAFGNGC